jgi:thiamine-phosphate pyrophosphorylase
MSEPADRRRAWLQEARLYLISDAGPAGRDLEEFLRTVLQAGVDIVQLRDKSADAKEIVRAGRVFRRLCDAYDALFIVNDRPDLAIACGADGVHIGQEDGALDDVRRSVGPDMLIGRSTHSRAQIDGACRDGADYIAVGPVYATPTKPDYPPVGLDLVRYATMKASVPFFAIGGIDSSTAVEVASAGASRVAVVRAITEADEPGKAAERLLNSIASHAGIGA